MKESPSQNDIITHSVEQDNPEPNPGHKQSPLNWFQIWRMVTLPPSIKSYKQILNDPKAGALWGVFWMGASAIIIWFAGPNRPIISGLVADNFGRDAVLIFLLGGALLAPILGVTILVVQALLSRSLAQRFGGSGRLDQLIYCWGVTHLPFSLVIGFVTNAASIFPASRQFAFSPLGLMIQITTFVILAAVYLFLLYAVAVGFAAVEDFGFSKALGLFLIQGFVLLFAISCPAGILGVVLSNLFLGK